MKNLFLLPTPKPSILYYHINLKQTVLTNKYIERCIMGIFNQNIYITSNEEIKEGDWCISLCNDESYEEIYQCKDVSLVDEEDKKIILTTDQDLIKDGVQAIDDEFLEWFIKNPSCEKVEVNHERVLWKNGEITHYAYKIIIPKEEPKQETLEKHKMIECYFTPKKDTSSATICNNCGQEKFLHTIGEGVKVSTYVVNPKEEPKQETLEEALNRFKEEHTVLNLYPSNILQNIAEFGAKWQQERSYSEEEVLDLLCARNIEFNLYEGRDEVEKWFKQFKKKTN